MSIAFSPSRGSVWEIGRYMTLSVFRPGVSSISKRSTIRQGRSFPASGGGGRSALLQTNPYWTTRPSSGRGRAIRRTSVVHQRIQVRVTFIHPIGGNPLDLFDRHVVDSIHRLPVLPQHLLVL